MICIATGFWKIMLPCKGFIPSHSPEKKKTLIQNQKANVTWKATEEDAPLFALVRTARRYIYYRYESVGFFRIQNGATM